jgi:predicted enzyme related to lactoylglutathione lyase
MNEHEKINYVEFPAKDIEAAKSFFGDVFGWSFVDFGPDYTAFSRQCVDCFLQQRTGTNVIKN